jgi:hypothetical protein
MFMIVSNLPFVELNHIFPLEPYEDAIARDSSYQSESLHSESENALKITRQDGGIFLICLPAA